MCLGLGKGGMLLFEVLGYSLFLVIGFRGLVLRIFNVLRVFRLVVVLCLVVVVLFVLLGFL